MSNKPPLVAGEHVLIITQINPYTPISGVSVVMHNLLSAFDPGSFTCAYLGRFAVRSSNRVKEGDCVRLIPNWHPAQVVDVIVKGLKQDLAVRRAVMIAQERKAGIVVGLYPTLSSLAVATTVAKRTGARFFPYLHDTVSEGLSHTPMAEEARRVQDSAFHLSEKILTMSEGMSDYYREALGRETYPLEHSFPEQIGEHSRVVRERTAFWGGDVYAINNRSFARVQRALLGTGTDVVVTSLKPLNIDHTENVRQGFYPTRREYLDAVQRHGIVILALNWPDESPLHEAELSTIFPTKAIEYLATGSPILVHCPDHYFLATFFRKHRCGVVVSERQLEALTEAIGLLHSRSPAVRDMQSRALATAELFSMERVGSLFSGYLRGEEDRPPAI